MQRVLEKIAKQLNSYDEASLMQLWQHYAIQVNEFEPTKRWEEAAIALCLIQSIHWKNQLFNYHLASSTSPNALDDMPPMPDFFPRKRKSAEGEEPSVKPEKTKATVLAFPSRGKSEESE